MKKRHTPEQIVRLLRQADAELATGASVPEVARRLGISEATFHRWRNHYGGMKANAMKRLKKLESENSVKTKFAQLDYPAVSHMRNVSVLIGEIAVSKGDATHFLTTGSDARQTPVAAKARGADRISAPLARSAR
jgi:putative transposase